MNFLSRSIAVLGLEERVDARLARAEDLAHSVERETFATVTARSFAAPAITAEVAAGLLRPGGLLAVAEPPGNAESRWSQESLSELGLGVRSPPAPHVAILWKAEAAPSWAPRTWKKLQRSPLF